MRKDGMRVTNLDAVHKIMPHLMENRCNAEVYSYETIDVTDLLKYLDKLNKNSEQKITLFHAVVTAIAKTIYNRPLLNRFIAGKRFYDRNYISISFVAKNKLEDNAEERLIILKTNYNMNLFDISNKNITFPPFLFCLCNNININLIIFPPFNFTFILHFHYIYYLF